MDSIITTTTANPPHNNGVPTVFIISPYAKKKKRLTPNGISRCFYA
ncbi:possible drug efflux protein,STY3404 [Salmonella enterica subsp. enterica serovar Bovismorbificans str. 3114]|nr:possible drug efflux protein,STY3404 [Salmonella enterica subsp. enterica serovar Bovismorbificans str. 3114]